MLVLSRRLNEKILIPGLNISIHVVDIKGHAARIGIEAPPDVAILRQELLARPEASGASRPGPPSQPAEGREHLPVDGGSR